MPAFYFVVAESQSVTRFPFGFLTFESLISRQRTNEDTTQSSFSFEFIQVIFFVLKLEYTYISTAVIILHSKPEAAQRLMEKSNDCFIIEILLR